MRSSCFLVLVAVLCLLAPAAQGQFVYFRFINNCENQTNGIDVVVSDTVFAANTALFAVVPRSNNTYQQWALSNGDFNLTLKDSVDHTVLIHLNLTGVSDGTYYTFIAMRLGNTSNPVSIVQSLDNPTAPGAGNFSLRWFNGDSNGTGLFAWLEQDATGNWVNEGAVPAGGFTVYVQLNASIEWALSDSSDSGTSKKRDLTEFTDSSGIPERTFTAGNSYTGYFLGNYSAGQSSWVAFPLIDGATGTTFTAAPTTFPPTTTPAPSTAAPTTAPPATTAAPAVTTASPTTASTTSTTTSSSATLVVVMSLVFAAILVQLLV